MNAAPRPFLRALAASLLALGLAGCSSDEPAPPPTSPAAPNTTSDHSTAEPTAEETPGMPLDPYRAMVGGRAAFDAEKTAAEVNRREELRARCMREQGFEYFYTLVTAEELLEDLSRKRGPAHSVWDDRGTIDFAEKYGFGFVHFPESDEEQPAPEEQSDPTVDPETEYLESLSESDREAWQVALWGDPELWAPEDDSGAPDPDEWKTQGCTGWAKHEASGGKLSPDEDPAFAELVNAIDDAVPTPDNDDDMAALEAEWSACMAADGFSFTVRQDAAFILEEELDDLWPRDSDGKPDQAQEPTDEQRERFSAEREFPVAIADATCAEAIDYVRRHQDITVAFEQRFIDEHRAELDALMLQHG